MYKERYKFGIWVDPFIVSLANIPKTPLEGEITLTKNRVHATLITPSHNPSGSNTDLNKLSLPKIKLTTKGEDQMTNL